MSSIILKGNRYSGNTIVSNCFIDEYMAEANGAQLKIYLYLMRCIEADEPVSVSLLADRFNYTETDIIRSLLYWARKGIVSLEFDEDRNVSGIVLNDPSDAEETEVNLPKKPADKKRRPSYTSTELSAFGSKKEIKQLIFAAEQYLSRPLSPTDMKSLLFMYDGLGFSTDLIEYLIEYCVCKGKTSVRYMEQTAMNWADEGVRDVAGAKAQARTFAGNDYYAVLKAFGISGRDPVDSEIAYIDKWKEEYGFSMDIILKAVGRTMQAIAKPSFPYTDSILKSWSENGDASSDDSGRQPVRPAPSQGSKKDPRNSKIHFSLERQYDFDELEERLLEKQSKKYSAV